MPTEYKPTCLRPKPLPQEVRYAIGEQEVGRDFNEIGFWQGPHPDLQEMLEIPGQSSKSVIVRFNTDGTSDIIWQWQDDRWVCLDDLQTQYAKNDNEPNVQQFHSERRMFCIVNGHLYLASSNLTESHAQWFQQMGWPVEEIMLQCVRGIVDKENNIRFYVGYDFEVTTPIELLFFVHLKELVQQLQLPRSTDIFGGAIRSTPGTIWPPRKSYGKVQDWIGAI